MFKDKLPNSAFDNFTSEEARKIDPIEYDNIYESMTLKEIREAEEKLRVAKIKRLESLIGDYDPEEDQILELHDID